MKLGEAKGFSKAADQGAPWVEGPCLGFLLIVCFVFLFSIMSNPSSAQCIRRHCDFSTINDHPNFNSFLSLCYLENMVALVVLRKSYTSYVFHPHFVWGCHHGTSCSPWLLSGKYTYHCWSFKSCYASSASLFPSCGDLRRQEFQVA